VDYSRTLNLPRTDFPMRANLPRREPEILRFWDEIDIYRLVQEKNAGRPKFILHDGPPYANGHIHLGHVLNKVLKDIVVKFHSMAGYDAPFIPGWDTHGLPIEQQAIKELGLDRHRSHPVEFRRRCKEYALKYVEIQREEFRRLGVRADWQNAYLTLQPHFEARQLEVFGRMAAAGYIYKGLKPVYWCASCETALAEAEVEYHAKESPSIWVRFPVLKGDGLLPVENTGVVIWTTTPWTLPANVAIYVHPEYEYVLARAGDEQFVCARARLADFAAATGRPVPEVVKSFKGDRLEGLFCRHPFVEGREVRLILGEYVTLDQGTGCVHCAPGHGEEDFVLAQRYGLPVLSPIDGRGYFTAEGGVFAGQFYLDANPAVVELLARRGMLLAAATVEHQYPHCWRCKNPVFYRATEQWFASVDGFRRQALAAINQVRWIPAWGRDRIYNMIATRGDWCISRQRIWGVPLPIFYCRDCGKELLNEATIDHLRELFRRHGSDIWYEAEPAVLLPPGQRCPQCGAAEFTKETDTMDVWFDSGSSHLAVLDQPEYWPDQRWPADLYLEGSDQHRGWFNSSLCTSVAVTGRAPYRAVLTHGFVVDEQGYKMSKSLGNVIEPQQILQELGADILRLWVCSADYRNDLAVSANILRQLADAYRKIRNTFRFLLGNLYDFEPRRDAVPYEALPELDRWALLRLYRLCQRVLQAYRDYDFHLVYHAVHHFCTVDMSALYLDVIKDRLYTFPPASCGRRAAQTVLYEVLSAVVRLLAPVLAFTTEEVWQHMPGGPPTKSVQLADMPVPDPRWLDEALEERWGRLLTARSVVNRGLEEARRRKLIGNSLEAAVTLYADHRWLALLETARGELEPLFIVSAVDLLALPEELPGDALAAPEVPGLAVRVTRAPGAKCARCWMYSPRVGEAADHPLLCPRCAEVVRALPQDDGAGHSRG